MNDDKRTRYTRRGALGLMALGGGFAILETLGFDQTTSERDTTIAVDDDGNALLGIDENPSNEDDETVRFTNRANEQFSVTLSSGNGVAFDVDQDDTLEPNPSFTLEKSGQSGDETLVDVVRTSGSGDADVDITATLSSTTISATRTLATGSSDQLTVTRDTNRLFGVSVTTGSSTGLADIDEIELVDNDNTDTFNPASQEDFIPRIDEAFERATRGGSAIGGDTATLGVSESDPKNRNVDVRFDSDSTNANDQSAVDEVRLRDENKDEKTFSSLDTSSQNLLDLSLTSVDTGGVVVGEIEINLEDATSGDLSNGDEGTFIVNVEDGGGEVRVNEVSTTETARARLDLSGNDTDSLEPSETLRIRVSGNTATLPSGGETVDLTLLESDGTTVINRFTASV
jgi:hypothetical protein